MLQVASEETVRKPGPWLQAFSPKGFEWNRWVLPIADLPTGLDGFKIIHLSDLHFRNHWPWFSAYDDALQQIADAQADMILITGDFVENKRNHVPALPNVKRFIAGLQSRLGTFAIPGNHDTAKIIPNLANENLTLVEHQRIELETGNGTIELISLNGVKRMLLDMNFVNSLPDKQSRVPRIVMSHFPDTIKKTPKLNADLFLAGHTHGGQCCLPGGFALLRHDSLPRKFCKGVHRYNDTWLIVNRGLGYSGLPPMRVFCPSEVIEIVLTRGTGY